MDNLVLGVVSVVFIIYFYNAFKIMKAVDEFISDEMSKSKEIFDRYKKENPSQGILSKGVPLDIWDHNLRSSKLLEFRKAVSGIKTFFFVLLFLIPITYLGIIISRLS